MLGEKATNELNEVLKNTNPDNLDEYFKANRNELSEEKSFRYFLADIYDEKHIKRKDVYTAVGVSESYGGRILRMEGPNNASRDLIIRFCLVGKLTLEETNRALELYKLSPLYPRDKRDACLIVAINKKIYDIADVDDLLAKENLKIIS